MHYVTPFLQKFFDPKVLPIILHTEDIEPWGTEDKLYQIAVTNYHYPLCSVVGL